MTNKTSNPPGRVRDSILSVLEAADGPLSSKEIRTGVETILGAVPGSSVRSYLQLNTPGLFVRETRGVYALSSHETRQTRLALFDEEDREPAFQYGNSELFHADCLVWLTSQPDRSIHAVVTDPPYGLREYTPEQQAKLRNGKGGVWRIPPSFDGSKRSPVPRFTTIAPKELEVLHSFFLEWAVRLIPKLVPGANVLVASNPLLSHIVASALAESGLEKRGSVIRLVMTMRGGDRPKGAHEEYPDVSVMPRSMWEPWLVYRCPLEGRVRDNLRKWGTGGFRRPRPDLPFGDVISSAPTRKAERSLALHPSLKPQAFVRQIVRAALPLGKGTILDPFAGAGSTLAAAEAIGYRSIGIEKDRHYFAVARDAIPKLASLDVA